MENTLVECKHVSNLHSEAWVKDKADKGRLGSVIYLPGRREEAISWGRSSRFLEMSMEKASPPTVSVITSPIFFRSLHCFPAAPRPEP